MATQVANAVATLNAQYNAIVPASVAMPTPLRDRMIAAFRKLTPNPATATNEDIAKTMNAFVLQKLREQLDFSEAADLAAANRAQINIDFTPIP